MASLSTMYDADQALAMRLCAAVFPDDELEAEVALWAAALLLLTATARCARWLGRS